MVPHPNPGKTNQPTSTACSGGGGGLYEIILLIANISMFISKAEQGRA
jgi:hypothetical protein